MSQNIQLTPIQTDYNKLFGRTEEVFNSAVSRLQQIDKEITVLENEKDKLDQIIENTRATINHMK